MLLLLLSIPLWPQCRHVLMPASCSARSKNEDTSEGKTGLQPSSSKVYLKWLVSLYWSSCCKNCLFEENSRSSHLKWCEILPKLLFFQYFQYKTCPHPPPFVSFLNVCSRIIIQLGNCVPKRLTLEIPLKSCGGIWLVRDQQRFQTNLTKWKVKEGKINFSGLMKGQ